MDLKDHFHVTGDAPEELDRCPVSGFSRCRHPVVDRTLLASCAMGAILGASRGGLAVRATFGGCPRNGRSGSCRHPFVGRLGAPALCTDSVRCDRDDRWVFSCNPTSLKRMAKVPMWASIFHADCAGNLDPVLGCITLAPLLAILYAYKARQQKEITAGPKV